MTVLAIPDPQAIDLARVDDFCTHLELQAQQTSDVAALKDASHRLGAIAHYLESTSTEGLARIEATRRRLEVRVGEVLGEATRGAHSSATEGPDLTRHERHDFRRMAAAPEIVERVIAESTDEAPPSRRKILAAIDQAKEVRQMVAESKAWEADVRSRYPDAPTFTAEEQRQLGALRRLCLDLPGLGEPDEMHALLRRWSGRVAPDLAHVIAARDWLDAFLSSAETRCA